MCLEYAHMKKCVPQKHLMQDVQIRQMKNANFVMVREMTDKHFGSCQRGFHIVFSNGWCMDASIGPGVYCENRYGLDNNNLPEVVESDDCETIVQDNTGHDRTLMIGMALGLRVDGEGESGILPYLKFENWLRVFDYVRQQEAL